MLNYDHYIIEKKWQNRWEESKVFECDENSEKKKYYCLSMFAYPSGNLHMGHIRNYSIGDIFARFYRMKGRNVLHPIGWDAFGLPAENAAIKNNIHPAKWTRQNIYHMRKQFKSLGISYDWSKEFATCDPEYYKWNQWFFIKMWEKGLIFRKNALVNWCSSCATVLANEQVLNGMCWRCDGRIENINLKQWFIKITNYADELFEGHKYLVEWPKQVLLMQKKWIGKSSGMEIDFLLNKLINIKLKIFTTRSETIFGVTFIVIAPEHEIINKINYRIGNYSKVLEYVHMSKKKSIIERTSIGRQKSGIELKNIKAVNPVTGKELPIFVSDYVLPTYGTGAIMAVPAHDKRDFEFAKKYNIPIVEVIDRGTCSTMSKYVVAYEGEGILINSAQFDGLKSTKALNIISEWIEEKGFGKKTINFKIRDWLISRQRYWGTPIPMIYCKICGIVPVPNKDLPVILPENIEFTCSGDSPLKLNKNFLDVKCPQCGINAKRETDTMDTFVDSSWYYLRHCGVSHNHDSKHVTAFDPIKVDYWMPVDQYIGGIEHACMHLIYSRFWYKIVRDLGLTKQLNGEPFTNLLTQGMVTLNGVVMSKSKGNIISPDKIVEKYGADTVRLFIFFVAPPQKQLDWSSEGIEGCWRFINRIWRLFYIINKKSEFKASENDKLYILKTMHYTIKKVTIDIEKKSQFNTAISSIMELVNALYNYKYYLNDDGVSIEVYKTIILLMTPFTPHVCEEIWEMLAVDKGYVSMHAWPDYDESMIKNSSTELPVQINGRVKGKIIVPVEVTKDEIIKIINSNEKIIPYLKDKCIVKFIYIKNKIVTMVVK
ncbi:MAG: leucine--tRNA ligase [Endomicrobium sp.]|jgi:leucyl-tRNA synthetase|nr:leucine--tRNA ligase [Endomicrobium sp.]